MASLDAEEAKNDDEKVVLVMNVNAAKAIHFGESIQGASVLVLDGQLYLYCWPLHDVHDDNCAGGHKDRNENRGKLQPVALEPWQFDDDDGDDDGFH